MDEGHLAVSLLRRAVSRDYMIAAKKHSDTAIMPYQTRKMKVKKELK
jgi:hypothetical protein